MALFATHAVRVLNAERELVPSLGVEDDPALGPPVHHHRVVEVAAGNTAGTMAVTATQKVAEKSVDLAEKVVEAILPTNADDES